MENAEIGKKLKVLRKSRGLTQQDLADRLECRRSTISNYEIGRRSPRNVHLDERYMFVEKAKTRAGIRNVPIHEKIMPLIAKRFNQKNKFLCLNERGKQLKYQNFYSHHFEKNIRPLLVIDHNIHETRHTFISQCDRMELNTVTVQRIVGHENKTVTQDYTDKTIQDMLSIIALFEY